ncbi:hypothetical protein EST38_g5669 [Candolleomyces aberdarensis]|uniref:N-acetyltransferase domain-containing protein n=1 Tax=Candolleomyces aberdarensis TaxID=2316362 RepID=A0A4Q2DLK2_9AGAR|nr:hypothetical protein EST38_g5669 [Candolleomyces aberdarensis]
MTTTDKGKDTSKPAPTPNWKLFFSQGLEGYDETWELLIPLFEQLQLVCADVANPTLDVLTFAHTAHYFSVLHVEKIEDQDVKSGNEEGSSLDPCQGNTSARSQGVSFSDFDNEGLGSSNQWAPTVNPQDKTPIGLLYLQSSQNLDDYLRSGELNVGVFIDEKHRGRGYARQAIQKALQVAFDDQNCHRVQAVLVDSPYKDQALSLFMMCGMGHEGVRRRGFRSPWNSEFKDVTYLGLLATDWFIRDQALFKNRNKWTPAAKSLWDEMFARHQREREELLRWEDRRTSSGHGKLKRTSSMETIKQVATSTINALSDYTDDDMYDESESVEDDDSGSVRSGSVASSSSSALSSAFSVVSAQAPRKRRRTSQETEGTSGSWSSRGGSVPPSSNESEPDDYVFEDDEEVASSPLSNLIAAPERHIPEGLMNWLTESSTRAVGVDVSEPHRGHSPTLSEDSDLTEISDGYATSTSSRWDVIERGSTPGLSDLDDDAPSNM